MHVCLSLFFVCVSVFLSYPALAEAGRAGRGGAGRFSRVRSGHLTGRHPVHWREGEKERWSRVEGGG